MTTPQGGVGPTLSFSEYSPTWAMLAAADEPGSFFWPVFGIISQVLIAVAIVCHVAMSRRAGRFELSAGIILVGMAGAFLGVIYAVVHREWIMVVAESLGVVVAVRLLALIKPEEVPEPQVEKPRLPVVAPDSAEIKLTSLQPRQPQR